MDLSKLTTEEVREQRPDLVAELIAKDTPSTDEEEDKTKVEPKVKAEDVTKPKVKIEDVTTEDVKTESDRVVQLEKRLAQSDARAITGEKLNEADLPASARALVESDFADAECTDTEKFGKQVDERIAKVIELLKEAGEIGRVKGVMVESDRSDDFSVAADIRGLHGIKEVDKSDGSDIEKLATAIGQVVNKNKE